jgi:hypothetical protein
MEENQNPQPLTKIPTSKQSIVSPIKLVIIILIIIIIAGIGYFGKYYYSKLFVRAQNNIGNLQTTVYWQARQIDELNSYRAYADSQISYLSNNQSTYTPTYTYVSPDLTIGDVLTYTPDNLATGQKLLLVDFLAKNNTGSDIYFYSGNYKLKDNNDYQYSIYYNYNTSLVLPDGRTQVDNLLLKPGEQTRGTMVYLLTRNDFATVYLSDQNSGASIVDINASAL